METSNPWVLLYFPSSRVSLEGLPILIHAHVSFMTLPENEAYNNCVLNDLQTLELILKSINAKD